MFQLAATPEPRWEDVAPGIRIQFRYGPAEALTFGRRHVRSVIRANDTVDPEFHFVCGVAAWGARAWEGVGGETGDSLAPLTIDNLTALMSQRPDIYDEIDRLYVEPILKVQAEGNGSGPSPNGTSTEAPTTATPAPASAPTAPTGSTSPRVKRGKGSGPSSKAAPSN